MVLAWGVLAVFLALATLAALPPRTVERLHGAALGWQAQLSHDEALAALILLLAVKFGAVCWIVSLRPVRLALTPRAIKARRVRARRSEEHTSELQSLMRISYAVFCLKKKKTSVNHQTTT